MLAMKGIYQGWSKQYGGLGIGKDALTYQFAQQFSSTPEQADLMQSMLMAPSLGFENMYGARRVQDAMLSSALQKPTYRAGIRAAITGATAVGRWFEGAGETVRSAVSSTFENIKIGWNQAVYSIPKTSLSQFTAEQMYGANTLSNSDLGRLREISATKYSSVEVLGNTMREEKMTKLLGMSTDRFLRKLSSPQKHGEEPNSIAFINSLAADIAEGKDITKDRAIFGQMANTTGLRGDFNAQAEFARSIVKKAGYLNREFEGGAQTLSDYRSRSSRGDKTAQALLSAASNAYASVLKDTHQTGVSPADVYEEAAVGLQPRAKTLLSAMINAGSSSMLPTPAIGLGGDTSSPYMRAQYKNAMGVLSAAPMAGISTASRVSQLLPGIQSGRPELFRRLQGMGANEGLITETLSGMGVSGEDIGGYLKNRSLASSYVQTFQEVSDADLISKYSGRVNVLKGKFNLKGGQEEMVRNLLLGKEKGVDLGAIRKMFSPSMDLKGLGFEQVRQQVAGAIDNQLLVQSGPASAMKKNIADWTEYQTVIDKNLSDNAISGMGKKYTDAEGKSHDINTRKDLKDAQEKSLGKDNVPALLAALLQQGGPGGGGSSLAPQAAQPAINNYWNNRWFASGVA
jgi:hypothetical protein